MKNINIRIERWVKNHYLNLAIYNIFLILLVLLHSAQYFDPFWLISINVIVLLALIVSIFLLGAKSRVFFIVALLFWFFAAFLKFVKIDVWAERPTIYAFEALVIGVITFFLERE